MRHPPDDLLRLQVELFRRMTPEQKLGVLHALQRSARALTAAGNALRRMERPSESLHAATGEAFPRGPA